MLDSGRDLDKGTARTASGSGRHFFYHKDEDERLHWSLPKRYPGIDFKQLGGYVVARGSYHPGAQRVYQPLGNIGPDQIPLAPSGLIEAIRRPPRAARTGLPGKYSNEALAECLAVLDPVAYRDYADWIAITAAAHDWSNGTGFDEWAAWCRRDPEHADEDSDYLGDKWDSFEAGRAEGATYKKVLWAVVDAGRKDIVARLGVDYAADFPDDIDDFSPVTE